MTIATETINTFETTFRANYNNAVLNKDIKQIAALDKFLTINRHYEVRYQTNLDGFQHYEVINKNGHRYYPRFRFLNFNWCGKGFALSGAVCQCARFAKDENCHHIYLAVMKHCDRIGIDTETALQVWENFQPAKKYVKEIHEGDNAPYLKATGKKPETVNGWRI